MNAQYLAERFEGHRSHLRAVAYRMLGSLAGADDAVQETWIRLDRSDTGAIDNLGGWLTTVIGRVCLNMLRARTTRREDSFDPDVHVPDPDVTSLDAIDPEREVVLADSVGLAMLVVLETLAPVERLVYVLHDMFKVPFEEVATIADRTPAAARQIASRARRKVERAQAVPDAKITVQRSVVDAFFAAARGGDFEALVAVLDPEVVLRSDAGPLRLSASTLSSGREAVARRAMMFAHPDAVTHPAIVNGRYGVVVTMHGEIVSVMEFTVVGHVVAAIHALADPHRIAALALTPPG